MASRLRVRLVARPILLFQTSEWLTMTSSPRAFTGLPLDPGPLEEEVPVSLSFPGPSMQQVVMPLLILCQWIIETASKSMLNYIQDP